jgi:hypothetical protein
MSSSAAFEMTVPVLSGDIDEQNHVNNTVYLRWVQDVATAHWRAIASPEAQQMIGWVVLRHEIDYKGAGHAWRQNRASHMGGAKPPGSPSNGSLKPGARAIASSCRKRARSGVPSIRRPGVQAASQRNCARNSPPEGALS